MISKNIKDLLDRMEEKIWTLRNSYFQIASNKKT